MEIEKIKDKELQEPVFFDGKADKPAKKKGKSKKICVKWPSKKKVAAEVVAVVVGSLIMFMLISAGDAVGVWLMQGVAKIM